MLPKLSSLSVFLKSTVVPTIIVTDGLKDIERDRWLFYMMYSLDFIMVRHFVLKCVNLEKCKFKPVKTKNAQICHIIVIFAPCLSFIMCIALLDT